MVQGYSPGAHIQIQGMHHAICLGCERLTLGMTDVYGERQSACEQSGLRIGVKPQNTWMEEVRRLLLVQTKIVITVGLEASGGGAWPS